MQIVVSSFETVTGFETAKTYTSLGTISRHFQFLRDAVVDQICVSAKVWVKEKCIDLVKVLQSIFSTLHMISQKLSAKFTQLLSSLLNQGL